MKNREDSINDLLVAVIPALAGHILINAMPAEVVSGALIMEGYAGAEIDPEITGMRRARFQIAVRDNRSKYTEARALADQIIDALTTRGERRVPDGILIKSCRALTEPIPYPISDGNNIKFSLNFFIIYVVGQ
ncbi:minor capsid protein [Castellaniella sp. UC4442_H9]